MSLRTQELALILSCLAWSLGGPCDSSAQSNSGQKPQSDDPAGRITSFPPTTGAQFNQVPIATPAYPVNPYVGYNGLYGGYLSGAADVINASGNFLVANQQANQMKEQVLQAKIDTRRKNLDEYLYERAVTPTVEDDRERARIENLRRARNDPPVSEIWSGQALNDLLLGIQQQHSRGLEGPRVYVREDTLKHINVSGGTAAGGSIGLLRQDGRLTWPLALRREQFKSDKEKLDQLAKTAYKQAASGAVDADTIDAMTAAVDSLTTQLKQNIEEISSNDYIKAKHFLNEFKDTITALQDPNVSKYVNKKWSAEGNTVGELTRNMTSLGLKFARAVTGDEAAYTALHSAMVAYFVYPDKPWDPVAK
jgi:hypothetical protein